MAPAKSHVSRPCNARVPPLHLQTGLTSDELKAWLLLSSAIYIEYILHGSSDSITILVDDYFVVAGSILSAFSAKEKWQELRCSREAPRSTRCKTAKELPSVAGMGFRLLFSHLSFSVVPGTAISHRDQSKNSEYHWETSSKTSVWTVRIRVAALR